ncbi:coiled-coil and C2 domain-containing protein 1B isoform X2 [Genypterus blacodes]|uniref:coiled-coil and C2 domain-containing protein 1B isoform X2 n=1 Tax=Genypterus blacodes TaxID=154954 RepID=UPI003F759527
MFAKKKRAPPPPKGHGAAAAKQMGLFVELDPEEMMTGMDDNLDDPSLEAELAALTGNTAAAQGKNKPRAKKPLPMEDISRMADECMKDVDDDEDDANLEDDEDLLAELQEVVGEGKEDEEDAVTTSSTSSVTAAASPGTTAESQPSQPQEPEVTSAPGSLQHTLEERIDMYKTALQNAKTAGETSKARRFDRGLKTLETMLSAVKKGRPVNEAEMPPPVATGAPGPAEPATPGETGDTTAPEVLETTVPSGKEEQAEESSTTNEATKAAVLERQREYKMAALRAKKEGDVEQAKVYFKTSKTFNAAIEALERGEAVDLSGLPPPVAQGGGVTPSMESSPGPNTQPTQPAAAAPAPAAAPSAPRNTLEALEQRRDKYAEAAAQAKAGGDDRKARMHDRIAKQYQSAIRTHKAGKPVKFDELPVPPGFPPIPGLEAAGAQQGFADVLEAANKLASADSEKLAQEDEDEEEESKPAAPQRPKKLSLDQTATGQLQKQDHSPSPDRTAGGKSPSPTAHQQLEFLEGRKKQYMKAALQAKQRSDMDQAKQFLRNAKGLDAMIEAARSGQTVDISVVPSPPGDEDEDFILVNHNDVKMTQRADEVYTQLLKILKEQYEKCLTYSKQFTHLGDVTETTKFEKMAESFKKSLEILKLSQARGLPPPKHHFEEKTYRTVRIFPELSSTEMVVVIVKGMNLPSPSGIQPNDLDAYIKFEFPYPSTEQPQKHKTAVMKNTNCPEYNQNFTLSINRTHRGFKRILMTKGLKLELLHKGGFLRSDKPIGTAQVKLEKLDTQSEIREIVEVMDGRKATGGRVEVKVRLREPLSGQDLQTNTEQWLMLDQSQVLI